MQTNNRISPRAGRLLARPAGHNTFEPSSLPPSDLGWTPGLFSTLSSAERELGFLYGQVAARPESAALAALACRREAVASCQLEGSTVTLADLMWYELDGRRADALTCKPGDARICLNYANVLQDGAAADTSEHPLLRRSLGALHGQLYRGVRGRDDRAGALRTTEIWLGPKGSTARSALYVPPAPEHIAEHLARLLGFAVEPTPMPPLAQLALIMYQLESIHPFVDGSGRVARLTVFRLLAQQHGPAARLLCLSTELAEDVGGHFRAAQRVRLEGDWEGWIAHVGQLLLRAAQAGTRSLERGVRMLQEHQVLVRTEEPTVGDTAITLLAHLASHPLVSVQMVARVCGRTYANANLLVRRLESLGLLREITGRQRHRRYVYDPYLALLQGDT